jgi:hypothetical protein
MKRPKLPPPPPPPPAPPAAAAPPPPPSPVARRGISRAKAASRTLSPTSFATSMFKTSGSRRSTSRQKSNNKLGGGSKLYG